VWQYHNPVDVRFGAGSLTGLPNLIAGRTYALVTYDEPVFTSLRQKLEGSAGPACLVIADVRPNPDSAHLGEQCARFAQLPRAPEVIVALGGGSVIDSAKVFAAAGGDFARVLQFLQTGAGVEALSATPLIAVPTTAGTGSEVTSWATVWEAASGKKYSLARPSLYPQYAVIDPTLMVGKPRGLTVSTGLDALSHALESLWNVNANPVSRTYAVAAAREILAVLPALADDLTNVELRSRMATAALLAGLAFSNTKTAIAHSVSYPITLHHNVQHGIACSFTLPMVIRSVAELDGLCRDALTEIFGPDLREGARRLEDMLQALGVSTDPASYGVGPKEWTTIVRDALEGERGRNFIGSRDAFLRNADPGGASGARVMSADRAAAAG
jgi:phosphonate metabolism-associated iron-containing alcohol dehydrogenase